MFHALRFKLAARILPRDCDIVIKFGAMCFGGVMGDRGIHSIRWRDKCGDVFCVHREDGGGRAKIRCVVCTNEFEGDADRGEQCPLCGSRDVECV